MSEMSKLKEIGKKFLEWGIYLWVFLLPWQTRWIFYQGRINGNPWEYGSYSLYGLDILFLLLLILRITLGGEQKPFSLLSRKKVNPARISNGVNLWPFIFGFLAICFVSVYWAWNGGLALYGFIKLAEGILIFWLITTSLFNLTKINIAFALAAVIQSLIGISQFLFQNSFGSKWLGMAVQEASVSGTSVIGTSTNRFLRAYGAFPHPNILAGFLLIGLIILIGLYFQAKRKEGQYLTLVGLVIITTGLFFTFSRANWLVLVAAFFFLLGMVSPKKYFQNWHLPILKILGIIFLIFLVFTLIYPQIIQTRFSLNERLEKLSIGQRMNYYQEAFKLIKEHSLTGVGLSNYTLAVNTEIGSSFSGLEYQPVHNVYVLVLAELGIFGLLIFLMLIGQILKESWVALIYSTPDSNLWLYVHSTILVALFLLFLFDHYFWTLSFGIMFFWFLVGLWQKALDEKGLDSN